MTMKTIRYSILALAALLATASCVKDVEDQKYKDNDDSAIFLYPEPEDFNADGTTASGDESYLAVVTVRKGSDTNSDLTWTASIEDNPSWVHLSDTKVTSSFQDEFSKKLYQIDEKGISIILDPNEGYRRGFTLDIKLSDGTAMQHRFSQVGALADASVTSEVTSIEFNADGGDFTLPFTSNMGDAVDFAAIYPEGSDQWLTWVPGSTVGEVTLTAAPWENVEEGRDASFSIIVGSLDTSIDTLTIPVHQLAKDKYYYMYGPSAGDLAIEDAVQMEKNPDKTYKAKAYFLASEGNRILFNINSRTLSYPCYALASDGTVAEIQSASAAIPDGPAIDIDGMRTLIVDFESMTWAWERISTQNCLPDNLVSEYSTKEYLARDGSYKTWMTEWFRWDGGGTNPKLGSAVIPSATGVGSKGTGGYPAKGFPSSWNDASLNPDYESTEIGGNLVGTSDEGRLYAFDEILNGNPRYGIGYARYETMPSNFLAGAVFTDAVGTEITVEQIDYGMTVSGDNAQDEKDHPMLTMQVQGICPYGWHIANAADWLDLAYAASKASDGHTYPVSEDKVTYKNLLDNSGKSNTNNENSDRGIGNFAAWLRNSSWSGVYSDGADGFGFNYKPIGFRYMTQGYQCYGSRVQTFVPLVPVKDTQAYRINVILGNTATYAEMATLDNGQAIVPFRCVKNYYKK